MMPGSREDTWVPVPLLNSCLAEVRRVLTEITSPPLRTWKQSQGLAKLLRELRQNMSVVAL